MKSKTKYEVNEQTIAKLFDKANIKNIDKIASLGAGEFNSVYSVNAEGMEYVIKIAPLKTKSILTYEKLMMQQEVYYYTVMNEQANINVPKVYFYDFSKTIIPTDYFIMERLHGKQIDKAGLTKEQMEQAEKQLAVMVAKMHSVKGDKYGYRQNELHDNWYLAIYDMVSNLIQDCKRFRKNTNRGERLLEYIKSNQELLEDVPCNLINFDIWSPNIFISEVKGNIKLSWIDPERCLWGDRIADFVCLEFMNMSLGKKKKSLQAYNKEADDAILVGREEKIRYAIMLGYLGLIMETEKYARYTILHFGYWRNVLVSKILFKNCFKQLRELMK